MNFKLNNTFTNELTADPNSVNSRRQIKDAFYSFVTPKKTSSSKLIHVCDKMSTELGISEEESQSEEFLNIFTGNSLITDSKPYAMCYGGHQFGNWAGQLGDGRAINLAEVEGINKRWVLQLKGAGETPYSRTADGLAVLRSSIREYLCSEAMYHLGVSTTRALSLSLSGDEVMRDVLYNGNPAYEKGAIVCRASESFIRFGNFEILAARGEKENIQKLLDYTIKHFYPECTGVGKTKYLQLFKIVSERTLSMIIDWQRVGFVHGVMNTDNMSILGQTIDYGPYGWLEGYDHGWTPNTTDAGNKRYRYGNQPYIGLWNLHKLANAIYPLIEDSKPFEAILEEYKVNYQTQYKEMMKAKIGLFNSDEKDDNLIKELENVLQLIETDMTIFFRNLANVNSNDLVENALKTVKEAFYTPKELNDETLTRWNDWLSIYLLRLQKENFSDVERKLKMDAVNPKYVLRNYMAQLAIDDADKGDYKLIDELYQLLKKPYNEQPKYEKWFAKRPDWARDKVGCSMLSCSS